MLRFFVETTDVEDVVDCDDVRAAAVLEAGDEELGSSFGILSVEPGLSDELDGPGEPLEATEDDESFSK